MNSHPYSRRQFLKTVCIGSLAAAFGGCGKDRRPNFIVIFCDDLGYGDIGCFGSRKNRTPHIDRMAAEGMRFTSFYVTSGVCSPSRASLMTGCYPLRVGLDENSHGYWVLFPADNKGLNPNEITIAELLKGRGYATACVGKWHLGDQPEFLPTRQGFDFYFGIPYSNDMGNEQDSSLPPLPLMRNEEVIEAPVDLDSLTRRYTEEAISFIQENRDRPFFLYLPHTMVHYPLHASEAFRGKSKNGIYGDAVEEIDWSTGEIMKTLTDLGIGENTLIVFTSDNGATRRGSNAPLSGFKAGVKEGSMRVPCVMRWSGTIPAGAVCNEIVTTMDFLPTFGRLAGAKIPKDRIIDGKDMTDLMFAKRGAKSRYKAFYYYFMSQLQAVRAGRWKLYLPLEKRQYGWTRKTSPCEAALYDLDADRAEKNNVIAKHPDVVAHLMELAEEARQDIGDFERKGKNQRQAGWIEHAKPLILKN